MPNEDHEYLNINDALKRGKQIMEEHDLAGIMMVTDADRIYFRTHINTTWGCARYDGETIRFNAPNEDFGSPAERQECIRRTIAMLSALCETSRLLNDKLTSILVELSKKYNITTRIREL